MFEDNDPLISYHSSLSLTARYLPRLYLQPGAHIRHPHLAGLDQLLHEPRDLRLLQQRLQEVKLHQSIVRPVAGSANKQFPPEIFLVFANLSKHYHSQG